MVAILRDARRGSIDSLSGPDWQAMSAQVRAAEDVAQCQQSQRIETDEAFWAYRVWV
ncbi:hypothetical protein [Roseateles sp.]|uniref:hypothetical protein n=1 Tax=Roseateles sp. TaxID=1971397 RepID=UPI00286D15A3|nr:hypothetical protein [Roseateles sp.]